MVIILENHILTLIHLEREIAGRTADPDEAPYWQ